MKIKKSYNKITQLQILKLQYKKKSYNLKTNLKQVEVYLNKLSNIIFKYHITNRKILFIGFPDNFINILDNTNHILIPEYIWFNGMLSNRISQTITKKQIKVPINTNKLLLKLKKKIDLIIVYNLDNKSTAIEESHIARIPIITLNNNLSIHKMRRVDYKSFSGFEFMNEKMLHNNIFYSLVKSTLARASLTKKTKNLKFRHTTIDFLQKKTNIVKNLRSSARRRHSN